MTSKPKEGFNLEEVYGVMKVSFYLRCGLMVATLSGMAAMRSIADETIGTNVTLNADADWRAKGKVTIKSGVTINLNGHNLTLAGFAGSGEITNPLVDLTVPDPSRVSTTTVIAKGGAASNLFNNNYRRDESDSTKRVLVAKGELPLVVDYDFGEGNEQQVNVYRLYCGPINTGFSSRFPKSWTIHGSNDKSNWVLLDTRLSETGWSDDGECRTKTFVNDNAYRYYRFTATAAQDNSDGYLELVQLEYCGYPPCSELRIDVSAGTKLENSMSLADAVDLTVPDPSRVSTTTVFAGGVASNLFNNNYQRDGVDNTKRVLVQKSALPLVVDYDFGAGAEQCVNMYRIYCGPIDKGFSRRFPKTWTIHGSNDKANWVLLDTRSSETGWSDNGECRTRTFVNTNAYRYYRFSATAAQNNTDGYLELVQLEYCDASEHQGVTISGGIKLVKDGEGTLVAAKEKQSHIFGTHIVAGTFKAGDVYNAISYAGEGPILVESGATLDINGNINFYPYAITLAGGTVANTGNSIGSGYGAALGEFTQLANLTLTADSYFNAASSLGMINVGHSESSINLGKHVLYVSVGSNAVFRLDNTDVSNGTLRVVKNDGIISLINREVRAKDAVLDFCGQVEIYADSQIGDLYLREDAKSVSQTNGNSLFRIFGKLSLLTDCFPNLELQDGATLDIAARDTVLSVVSTVDDRYLTFEDYGTYFVDVTGRVLSRNEKLVDWAGENGPLVDVEGLTFKLADLEQQKRFRLEKRNDGLYFCARTFLIVIR